MTKKELIEKLASFPDEMDVYVAERKTDFAYGLLDNVFAKNIIMQEEPGGKKLAIQKVIILDEE